LNSYPLTYLPESAKIDSAQIDRDRENEACLSNAKQVGHQRMEAGLAAQATTQPIRPLF
jgi:hypothetical protein